MKADKVLVNGHILTVDSCNRVAEAVSIKAGRIIKVGKEREVIDQIWSDTEVIDLEGRTVSPGFVDSHIHTVEFGFNEIILDLRYPKVQSIQDIKKLVEKSVQEKSNGEWIRGVGWDEALVEEKRAPTRFDLDPVSPENPVVLDAQTPYQVVNSYALELVDADYDDVFDGVIKSGELSWKIKQKSRNYTVEECMDAIIKAQMELLRVGVTAQKDAGCSDTMIHAYRRLHSQGKLRVRSYIMIGIHNGRTSIELAKEAVSKYYPGGNDRLYIGAVKCSFDGSGGNRTAWLYEPWNRNYYDYDGSNVGGPIIARPQDYPEIAKIIHRAGFQIGAHCVGDQTIDRYLEAIEAAILDTPRENSRHSIIHNNLPTEYALRKETELGDNIVIEATSAYLYFIGDTYAGNFGPYRSRRLIPLRTLKERGIVVGNGCDWNTCEIDPIYGLYSAMRREPRKGVYGKEVFGVDERVSFYDALRTYTWNSAYCMFWEDIIGSLEPGKYADLIIWSKDPTKLDGEEFLRNEINATMLEGEWVYGKFPL
jgi:hypothetical protein